jgi:hypothetical protein
VKGIPWIGKSFIDRYSQSGVADVDFPGIGTEITIRQGGSFGDNHAITGQGANLNHPGQVGVPAKR